MYGTPFSILPWYWKEYSAQGRSVLPSRYRLRLDVALNSTLHIRGDLRRGIPCSAS